MHSSNPATDRLRPGNEAEPRCMRCGTPVTRCDCGLFCDGAGWVHVNGLHHCADMDRPGWTPGDRAEPLSVFAGQAT
jgi:hypothetical protein